MQTDRILSERIELWANGSVGSDQIRTTLYAEFLLSHGDNGRIPIPYDILEFKSALPPGLLDDTVE